MGKIRCVEVKKFRRVEVGLVRGGKVWEFCGVWEIRGREVGEMKSRGNEGGSDNNELGGSERK